MNIAEWLARSARRTPEAPALQAGPSVLADYAAFAARSAQLADWLLREHGIQPGDRVALCMPNRADYLVALYGVWYAGAVVVPINAKLHAKELATIVDDCGARLLFVAQEQGALVTDATVVDITTLQLLAQAPALARPLPAAGADTAPPLPRDDRDLAWLFYTSGTTGRPKGVMLSHGNLVAMSLTYLSDVDSVSAEDGALYAAPLSHGAGLYNFVHVLRGARHVVPPSGGFDADEVLDLCQRCGPLSMFAAPTMVRRLTDAARRRGGSHAGLRTLVYGGGPMYVADIQDALAVFGPRFVQIYGQGESPMCITVLSRSELADAAHPRRAERLAGVGRAQACVDVRVVDAQGADVATGEVGEVVVRGPTVMAGYWNNPAATTAALRDGWLWTGDMGALDGDGHLTLKDRSKDLIISGGSNIYPREVEECLLLHTSVAEACVVGEADREWGENVVAFIVPQAGAAIDTADLDAHCLNHLARFKRPKRYQVVAALPKNHNGKVLKTSLRALLAPCPTTTAPEAP